MYLLVATKKWLLTPGWSTSWTALAKIAARTSRSVKTDWRIKKSSKITHDHIHQFNLSLQKRTCLQDPRTMGCFRMSFQALTFGARYQTLSQILFETVFKTLERNVRLTGVDLRINRIHFVFAFLFKFSNKSEVSTTDVICTTEKAQGFW